MKTPEEDPDNASRAAYDRWHDRLPVDEQAATPWHNLVRHWLNRFDDLAPGDALEIGCGRGGFSCWWASQNARPRRLVAADFSASAVEKAAAHAATLKLTGVEWRTADIESIPFPAGSFDIVVSCETVEHVPHPAVAFAELHRVLKPGGRLYLTTPNYLGLMGLYRVYLRLRGRPFTEEGQPINNCFFLPWVRRDLAAAGFKVLHTDAVGHYLPFPGAPPIRIHWLDTPRFFSRWFALHSCIVALKPPGNAADPPTP